MTVASINRKWLSGLTPSLRAACVNGKIPIDQVKVVSKPNMTPVQSISMNQAGVRSPKMAEPIRTNVLPSSSAIL